ncbi:MAG: GntR family transcriptional regulator [Tomitella sp.]|nr:GntR family transcriptional regulator [Tomitella sp.]
MDTIHVDPDAATPPFEQVRRQIITLIRDGRLIAGQRLPAVRPLATSLGIAANTVARTYRDLEAEGVIEANGRRGTFVAGTGDVTRRPAERAAVDFVTTARGLGFGDDAIAAMVSTALGAGPDE